MLFLPTSTVICMGYNFIPNLDLVLSSHVKRSFVLSYEFTSHTNKLKEISVKYYYVSIRTLVFSFLAFLQLKDSTATQQYLS